MRCAEIVAQLRYRRIEVAVMNDAGNLEEDCDLRATPIVLANDGAARMPLNDLARIHAVFPSALTVVVCDSVEGWALRAAIAAGAAGLVLAEEIPVALFPCLLAVSAGQVCIPRRHCADVEPRVLSVREKQILGLVVLGHMNAEIAER